MITTKHVRAWTLALRFGVLAGLCFGTAAYRFWPGSPLVRGLTIDERRLPEARPSAAEWLWRRRDAARARTVRFQGTSQVFEATLESVGVDVDVEATMRQAERVGHEGTLLRRLRESEMARRGEVDIPLVWTIDQAKARDLLATYAPAVARAPRDAHVDLSRHIRYPDEDGLALDVDASVAELGKGTHQEDETITLVTKYVRAKVTTEQLTKVDIERVLSAQETTFSLVGTGAGRAANIKRAASHLDGTVIEPGQVISFNDVVGPRTRDRGFALAPEILGDNLQMGYGGGTCQVSSTLHAAALYGALQIVHRQAHSRPSSYTAMGLDATVLYPVTDLKIRNILPVPLMVHAFLPKPTSVRIEILGGDPVAQVSYTYGVEKTEDFDRQVEVKDTLHAGTRVLHQKGLRGFDVTSVVLLRFLDGRQEERHYRSLYRPTPEIFLGRARIRRRRPSSIAHGIEGHRQLERRMMHGAFLQLGPFVGQRRHSRGHPALLGAAGGASKHRRLQAKSLELRPAYAFRRRATTSATTSAMRAVSCRISPSQNRSTTHPRVASASSCQRSLETFVWIFAIQ